MHSLIQSYLTLDIMTKGSNQELVDDIYLKLCEDRTLGGALDDTKIVSQQYFRFPQSDFVVCRFELETEYLVRDIRDV